MTQHSLEVVIFSFNRGKLLQNCVDSVRRLMAGVPITIFDDRSTDGGTCEVLTALVRDGHVRVLTAPEPAGEGEHPPRANGGLYDNLQAFVDVHARMPYALFLQDDMQVVRHVTTDDLGTIDAIFREYPRAAFVYPGFLYHSLCEYVDTDSVCTDGATFWFRYDYEFSGYFDVCIANIERLRAAGWAFGDELIASLSARDRFGTMRLLRRPFVAHLPSPPTYRMRAQSWTQSGWERYRAGLYPIDPLSDEALARLRNLKQTYPTAEMFLTSSAFWGAHPWPYVKLEGASAVVRTVDRIELGLRRRFGLGARWFFNNWSRR